ncbi:hypothetical protein [Paenibacillus mesotrionivorans]|uniref:Uncharacterized protein n=1 Tax=Paenibacillus mesotrionivorans TaxID=3160968 RepID=A0ACC7NXH1_9BACL
MSTTANPVTQTAEVEVNKASSQEMLSPFDETGKASKMEPIKMRAAKPVRIILEELSVKVLMEYFFSKHGMDSWAIDFEIVSVSQLYRSSEFKERAAACGQFL